MTCREKLEIEHPEKLDRKLLGGCVGCPHKYGYAKKPEWCENGMFRCWECWDREVEGVETDVETKADNEVKTEVKTEVETDVKTDVKTEVETEVDSGIKDSGIKDGEMTVFASGAVRDKKTGKGRCDLLPACVLLRLAKHYERGAERYGEYNWQQGIPCHSFADSALRHLLKYLDGQTDEDHLIAAIWNLCGLAWTEEKMPELMDIPERQGK